MQTVLPEAICDPDEEQDSLVNLPSLDNCNAVGVGPGIGKEAGTALMVKKLMEESVKPLVIDADALNIIAEKKLHSLFRKDMVITPHVREFERLTGKSEGDRTKLSSCLELSTRMQILVSY